MTSQNNSISLILVRLLEQIRHESGMTMEELADRATIHRTYIGLLEQNKRQPTVDVANRIAQALGVRLSDLIQQAEEGAEGNKFHPIGQLNVELIPSPPRRHVNREHFLSLGSAVLEEQTGFAAETIALALESTYHTLDLIDEQLTEKNTPPISQHVELANLSSMLGNLLGASIADGSNGLFVRNRPHAFPDLLAQSPNLPDIELKTALERNSPKGHLAKAGAYLTFRYVLTDSRGNYLRGRGNRGTVATVWEVKYGILAEEDFAVSNTAGDSGKTAVIKGAAFAAMNLIYYVPNLNPSARSSEAYKKQ